MNMLPAFSKALVVAALLSLAGCEDDVALAPPTLHCGRDTCAECGMIINEAKFAAAIIVNNDGVREHLMFDDVGDMFDYEIVHASSMIVARYVQDFAGGGWVAAESARYVVNPEVSTPMASGMVAFARDAGAERTFGALANHTVGMDDAREVRAARRRERFGR